MKRYIKSEKARYSRNKEKYVSYALNYYNTHKDEINRKKREKRRLINPTWFNRIPKIKIKRPKKSKIIWQNGTKERDMIKRYNLKWEEYQNLLLKCNNLCPLCGKQETRKRKDGTLYPLHVDHDHKTGKVRGLLCNKCNSCLGLINDDITILQKMIEYLELATKSQNNPENRHELPEQSDKNDILLISHLRANLQSETQAEKTI